MKRDALTRKLERIVKTIESKQTPTPVRRLYVYGSYRRGAIDCGDLDLVVVADMPTDDWIAANTDFKTWDYRVWSLFVRATWRALKKRGEKIELHVCRCDEHAQDFFKRIPVEDALLIWSEDDRDWRNKVASIEPNPAAGRHERPYPIDLKRTGTPRETMEDVLYLIDRQRLKMTRLNMAAIEPKLTVEMSEQLAMWRRVGWVGRDTLEVLPYAFDWLTHEGQEAPTYHTYKTEITSVSGTHLVHVGRINFGYALGWLFHEEARKLCLIPHLRKRTKNEMFIIERGPGWTGDRRECYQRSKPDGQSGGS